MRRRSSGVRRANELFGPELTRGLAVDPEVAIAKLEPLVTDERRARLQQVIAQRFDCLTVVMDAPHDSAQRGSGRPLV